MRCLWARQARGKVCASLVSGEMFILRTSGNVALSIRFAETTPVELQNHLHMSMDSSYDARHTAGNHAPLTLRGP